MRKTVVVAVILLAAGLWKWHRDRTQTIQPDCVAFADHLQSLTRAAIEAKTGEARDNARAHFEANKATAHSRLIAECRKIGSGTDAKGTYRCMMAATTLDQFKACP